MQTKPERRTQNTAPDEQPHEHEHGNHVHELIDTHCHLNIMVKKTFDTLMDEQQFMAAGVIVKEAATESVTQIINVGTSVPESINSIELAKKFPHVYAAVGIHPNDLKDTWKDDLVQIEKYLKNSQQLKIKAVGECGIDRYYPGYNLQRQKHAFLKQIELALKYDKALVIHSREAPEETFRCLSEFDGEPLRATLHCFSYDTSLAQEAVKRNFVLGIGGTVTYPRNDLLRTAVQSVPLRSLVLETDAPYLTPQVKRGKRNHPGNIKDIAQYLAELLETDYDTIAQVTTQTATKIFKLESELL